MFDIGFWELCLIAVVALLILGPERLPVAARTAGLWIGKARKMIGNVKSEIDRELQLDEVRSRLKEEEIKLRESTGIADLEGLAENTIADVESFQSKIDTNLEFADKESDSSEVEVKPKVFDPEDYYPENIKAQQVKSEEVKSEEVKSEEVKSEEVKSESTETENSSNKS